MATREIIDQEMTKGIEHGEDALRMGTKVDSLEEASDYLNTRIAFSKLNLQDFKPKFLLKCVFYILSLFCDGL